MFSIFHSQTLALKKRVEIHVLPTEDGKKIDKTFNIFAAAVCMQIIFVANFLR
jgi:hypothetical protein